MRIAVTGTPGTGKTTATELLESRLAAAGTDAGDESPPELEVIHLNRVLEDEGSTPRSMPIARARSRISTHWPSGSRDVTGS